MCGFSQYAQSLGWPDPSLGVGTVHPPVPLVTSCFGALITGSWGWLGQFLAMCPSFFHLKQDSFPAFLSEVVFWALEATHLEQP
jgi:hypothetical protein